MTSRHGRQQRQPVLWTANLCSPEQPTPALCGRYRPSMPRWLVLVLLIAVAGCTSNGKGKATAPDLPVLVLQPADVTGGFERFDEGRQTLADAGPGRADGQRFGRQGGWKARYRRMADPSTTGPLVVESRADVFAKVDGARKDLAAYRGALTGRPEPAEIGDEAVTATSLSPGEPSGIRFFTVVWREHNVTASVVVSGYEGRLSLGTALDLARRQSKRIAAATK